MGGCELAERLAEERPETKVIFISGYPGNGFPEDGAAGNVVAFLQKPCPPDALLEKVGEVLGVRSAVERAQSRSDSGLPPKGEKS
jgi:DNA-binding NarL/FixJ family response regulator